MSPTEIRYAQRITAAQQAWRDLPGPDTTWGLKMKAKIAEYYLVKESELSLG